MKEKEISKLYNSITNVDNQFIEEVQTKKKKKNGWLKWAAMAACFAVVALSIGLFRGGLFDANTDTANLDNGSKIVFVKSDNVGGSLALDVNVTKKPLTEDEISALFSDLSITANAIFLNNDIDADGSQKVIGFEGQIGNVKIVISTSDVQLLDTVIVGTEESSEINGITITAGYFVTNPNSKGEQNAIYYATFKIGGCEVYLENGGTKDDSETTKNQLAEVIQKLIENGNYEQLYEYQK